MTLLLLVSHALAASKVLEDRELSLNTAVVGQAIRPGFHLALETPLVVSPRGRLFSEEQLVRELSASVGLMGWWHLHNQSPLFVQSELTFRRTGARFGFRKELSAGLGLGYAKSAGWTYRYNEQGELWGTPVGGHALIAPSVGIGFGQDLSQVKPKLKVAWDLRTRMHYQLPYNVAGAPVFTFELGITRPWSL